MPLTISFLPRRPIWLALGACVLAHAADCHIEALSGAQRFNFHASASYFDVSKSYALGTPFVVKPGGQLAYRKIGRKLAYLVPDANIVYKPDWFLSISFKLPAGMKFHAESNPDASVPLHVIRQPGGQGNTQLLYVNQDGALCERVGSFSQPSGGFGAITTLVHGTYAAAPAEAHLQFSEEVDAGFSRATAVTLDEDGAAVLKLTLNVFNANGLERTVSKAFDRNAADDVQFEGWRFSLRKQADGSYQATVLAQPA